MVPMLRNAPADYIGPVRFTEAEGAAIAAKMREREAALVALWREQAAGDDPEVAEAARTLLRTRGLSERSDG